MTPSSRKKLGLALMIIPPVSIVAAPILFTLFNFIFSRLIMVGTGEGMGLLVAAHIINLILGIVGVVGLLGLFTALPIGLYLFFSTPKVTIPPEVPPAPPQA